MYETREHWLAAAVEMLRPRFEPTGYIPAEKIAAIVSWPKGSKVAIGQCFSSMYTKEGVTYVTVSPVLGEDPARVLDVLLHEMVHACGITNHGKEFKKVATAVGLEGKMRSTVASAALREELVALAEELGPYPHHVMVDAKADREKDKEKGKGTRIKLTCPEHTDYSVELNRKKYEAGDQLAPLCPHCHASLEDAS